MTKTVTTKISPIEPDRLAALKLGDFSPEEAHMIEHVLAELDIEREYPNEFGEVSEIKDMGAILAMSTSAAISATIGDLHTALIEANPETVMKSKGAVARWTGKAAETEIRYRVACARISRLVESAEQKVLDSEVFIARLDTLMDAHVLTIRHLRVHLAAGRLYMNLNAGKPMIDESGVPSVWERFGRRLSNLSLVLHSTQMAFAQIQLVKGQLQNQLDRLGQASKVLLTIWRNMAFTVLSSSTAPTELTGAYSLALSHLEGAK